MKYLLSFGSNRAGHTGSPSMCIERSLYALETYGCQVMAVSRLYRTRSVGAGRQPDYVNCAALIDAPEHSAAAMLRLANRLERAAGRHPMRRRGARSLDIDIVAAKGRMLAWPPPRGPRPRLVLPHPLAHTRAFVLDPVTDIAAAWRHEGLRCRFSELRLRLRRRRGDVVVEAPMAWHRRNCAVP